MRLLADENVPLATIRRLRRAGHDVESVVDLGGGESDMEVLRRATASERLLVTFDRDFGRLVFRQGLPASAGVVLLGFQPRTPEETATILEPLLASEAERFRGRFTVVERERIRQRDIR